MDNDTPTARKHTLTIYAVKLEAHHRIAGIEDHQGSTVKFAYPETIEALKIKTMDEYLAGEPSVYVLLISGTQLDLREDVKVTILK